MSIFRKTRVSTALVLALSVVPGSGWAHHSSAVFFDLAKRVSLTGTLTKVDWRNPHIQFSLEAKGDKGQSELWVIQSGPPGLMKNHSISKASFEKAIGQTITVEASPARDGSRSAELKLIRFPDGTTCCFELP